MRTYKNVEVELAYKVKGKDFELFTRIPINGKIGFVGAANMNASLPNAVLGVRKVGNTKSFHRLKNIVGVPAFPDEPAGALSFTKLAFRIRATLVDNLVETPCVSFIEIKETQCNTQQNAPLPAGDWLALVTFEGGTFKLLQKREGGPGPGDPCATLNCDATEDWLTKLRCWALGCYN
jgi:hypothetical protein